MVEPLWSQTICFMYVGYISTKIDILEKKKKVDNIYISTEIADIQYFLEVLGNFHHSNHPRWHVVSRISITIGLNHQLPARSKSLMTQTLVKYSFKVVKPIYIYYQSY